MQLSKAQAESSYRDILRDIRQRLPKPQHVQGNETTFTYVMGRQKLLELIRHGLLDHHETGNTYIVFRFKKDSEGDVVWRLMPKQ